jgi:hypothetical protein
MTYVITPYSYQQAKKLNVIIVPSHKKNKKIDVFSNDKKYITSIGDIRYLDYPHYIETKGTDYANERRILYKKRHAKYSNKIGSASFFASHILW